MVTLNFHPSPYDSSRILVLRNHFLFLLAKLEACPRSSVNEGCFVAASPLKSKTRHGPCGAIAGWKVWNMNFMTFHFIYENNHPN